MPNRLASLLFDSGRRLRNGWWIVVFVALIASTRLVYRPLRHGLQDLGVPDLWLEPQAFLFVLGVTWICTRLRREPLASVGFVLDRRWLAQVAAGTAIGVASILTISAMIWALGGMSLELDPARSASTLVRGAYVFLCVALLEETLVRGFVFQRLLAGTGFWPTQLVLALLFAAGHLGNPGMEGATLIVAMISLATGAILFGLAYLRTRSLALPIGLHFGWNWSQGQLLGFGVSGHEQVGWWRPIFSHQPEWLTGGAFGPEASVLALVMDLLVIVLLWRWRGVEPRQTMATPPSTPLAAEHG
jgi:membrane protease YdiL (CAAX protease family)